MEINHNLTKVLNDLIRINNDRIEGYQKASGEASEKDVDLKKIFDKMADESRQYVVELSKEVYNLGGEPLTSTTISGKIYRAWMDVKTGFTGSTRLVLLESCEHGEDATQKGYQQALVADETLSIDIRHLIANQKDLLKKSHDTIKRFRDMHEKADTDSLTEAESLRSSKNDLRAEQDRDTELTGTRNLRQF